MSHPWLAERVAAFDASGIRKVFDLAAKLKDPINLSIGQPDFAVPDAIKEAAIAAIRADKNGYSVTQGVAELRERLQAQVDAELSQSDRRVLVTSGTCGALVLVILALVNPGDEVIVFDPYFVLYPALVGMVGGQCVFVDTYPDFRIDPERVAAAITPRTKLILLNSPANPTGAVASEAEVRGLAELAARHNVALVSDEIYREFCYDAPPEAARSGDPLATGDWETLLAPPVAKESGPLSHPGTAFAGPARWNDQTIVIDGFSKKYGVTGWRLGFVHGPAAIIERLTMLQQYTFVCAPHPLQWAAVAALDVDMSAEVATYRRRRDMVVTGLRQAGYEVVEPGGAFYVFPKAPDGAGGGGAFVARAIENSLLVIPGNVFSRRDTHFRISYSASEATIERGLAVLRKLGGR